ncbi:MAG: amidase [Actinobacteria bacterium]|nr:amidase [Actinomycetota bacterium]
MSSDFPVVEKSIAELRAALDAGAVSSVELVAAYLNRIGLYDRHGITLNAVPVLNPEMFTEARASDVRRARGEVLSRLDGIPYTAKNSYQAKGLTVASGSPAFVDLVAQHDAFTIAQLRKAGAVLIGLTNMPPMANGGMQRGVYGRAESPYNADFLTAAFGSGSSNGSGTATAASFAAFGLGEETWSSGRAPASNNALCAYTPSRGVISTRGNWPLVPTMDVVVPHTRTMEDMLALLDVIVADDTVTRGNFWRVQPWIATPPSSELRPESYEALAKVNTLSGKRIAIPRMYINADFETSDPIETRESVVERWRDATLTLERLGAEVVETDFPVVTRYEDKQGASHNLVARELLPEEFADRELHELSMWGWNEFLAANGDPELHALVDVDASRIFPQPTGALEDRYGIHQSRFSPEDVTLDSYVIDARRDGVAKLEDIPTIAEGLRGLEEARRVDLEQWMDEHRLDAVVFPAVADVGPADMDVDPASAVLGWRNGTWVANGNVVIRHLGIPTVTVPMGNMSDVGMPVGLTFAGRGYDDTNLLAYASAFDRAHIGRVPPPRTPEIPTSGWVTRADAGSAQPSLTVISTTGPVVDGMVAIHIEIRTDAADVLVTVNGAQVSGMATPSGFAVDTVVPESEHTRRHSEWRGGYGSVVVAMARTGDVVIGTFTVVGGVA